METKVGLVRSLQGISASAYRSVFPLFANIISAVVPFPSEEALARKYSFTSLRR